MMMARHFAHLVLVAIPLLAGPAAPAAGPDALTVAVPMRDGSTLATDLYLPVGQGQAAPGEKHPVVLVCTPYGKSQGGPVGRWRDVMLRHGYAFAVQDMRGFHASEGAGKGSPRRFDGHDTVEWLAAQPWCNGRVGMMGYSHLGAAQYETAVTAPPHLACAIPAQAPANYYTDPDYPPCFRKADMETILRGAFTSRTGQLIRRRIRSREVSTLAAFNTPMLHSAGWYDFYKEGAIEMFRACRQHGGPAARGSQKLIIGPWGHGVLQEEEPGRPLRLDGGLSYPPNSKPDWEKEVWLPWFDHWLKGRDTGVMDRPAVSYYLMGAVDDPAAPGNQWIAADDFPPASTAVCFFAHADRTLRPDPSAAEREVMAYDYDPADPVPTVGRRHARIPVRGPFDQREVEDRPDVLLFTTPPLQAPLTIVGQIRVRLWASSDRADTDFTAKLTDVYPDGRSVFFADGIVKARHRNTYLQEEFLTPGKVYEFAIDLGCIAIALAPGHRLRLAISSSNFDRFDINPNTGEPYADHAISRRLLAERLRADPAPGDPALSRALVARNSLHLDRDHPTQVVLPVVDPGDLAARPEPAAGDDHPSADVPTGSFLSSTPPRVANSSSSR
jgi:predicted acyl esterase